jgi:hypothetical protein
MAERFHKGQAVSWKWGDAVAHGKIEDHFERRVSRTLKGTRVTRVGTADNPAYLIRQEDGDRVLKRASELQASGKES